MEHQFSDDGGYQLCYIPDSDTRAIRTTTGSIYLPEKSSRVKK